MARRITAEWRKASQGPEVTRRREEAAERLAEHSMLSLEEKISLLNGRLGKNVGAKKQRARYAALLESSK